MWSSPGHARTLQSIAETEAKSFYFGELGEKIDKFSRENGGYLRKEDLESFKPQWVEPLSMDYRGYKVWELPPNGQGLIVLMALNILKGFDFAHKEDALTYHRQIEAVKLAFADGEKHITDPTSMKVKPEDLLSEAYGEEKRRLIGKYAKTPGINAP